MFSIYCTKERKIKVPFIMAVGNGELMDECFPKHSLMETARTKSDKETDEEGKRGASMERSKAARKKEYKYNNNKHNMVMFLKKRKKYNENNSINKKQNDLNNREMT